MEVWVLERNVVGPGCGDEAVTGFSVADTSRLTVCGELCGGRWGKRVGLFPSPSQTCTPT